MLFVQARILSKWCWFIQIKLDLVSREWHWNSKLCVLMHAHLWCPLGSDLPKMECCIRYKMFTGNMRKRMTQIHNFKIPYQNSLKEIWLFHFSFLSWNPWCIHCKHWYYMWNFWFENYEAKITYRRDWIHIHISGFP